MAANITYLGEPGRTSLRWGVIDFPVGTPVLVDADTVATNGERIFYNHVLMKAQKNIHFTYEEVTPAARKKGKARDEKLADDDPPEEENGDTTIPANWRDMHHTRLIGLARRLGGGDDIASRDAAAAYIEACLKEQGQWTEPADA